MKMFSFIFGLIAILVALLWAAPAPAGVNVTLGWDAYSPPGDYSHAQLMQSELGADGETWTGWHEIARPDHAALQHTVADLPDGTYRWQLWAVDTEGLSAAGDTVVETIEDTSGPPPPIQNFRVISTTVVTIMGGRIVAHNTDSRVEPLPVAE